MLKKRLAEIQAQDGDAVTVKANLENLAGAQAVVAQAIATYGRVDVLLINNVGGAIWMKPFRNFLKKKSLKK